MSPNNDVKFIHIHACIIYASIYICQGPRSEAIAELITSNLLRGESSLIMMTHHK